MIRTKKKSTNTVKKLWQQKRLRYICYVVVSFLAIILIFNKPLSNLLVRSYQPIINQTVINHSNQIESKNDYSSVKN